MTIFIAILLTVGTFALVTYPFLRRWSHSVSPVGDDKLRELYSKRDTSYSMLKELEFDYQSGILTDEDYRELEGKYKGKAISILRDIDGIERDTDGEDDVEKQIRRLRRTKARPATDEVEKMVSELRRARGSQASLVAEKGVPEPSQDKGRFCTQCGAKSQESDRFCSHCGASLAVRRNH